MRQRPGAKLHRQAARGNHPWQMRGQEGNVKTANKNPAASIKELGWCKASRMASSTPTGFCPADAD